MSRQRHAARTDAQAWTTNNLLRTQLELENQIAKGLKLDVATALNPAKSQKSAIVTAIYKQASLHTRATVDLFKGPTFTADTVVGRDGFLVGAEATYDVTSGAITRYAGAVGFSAPEYAITLHGLGNLSTFAASYYHKVSKDVEAGAKAVYDTKSTTGGVSLEVGAKTYLVCLSTWPGWHELIYRTTPRSSRPRSTTPASSASATPRPSAPASRPRSASASTPRASTTVSFLWTS